LQEFLSRGEFMQYMDRFKAELKEDFAEIKSNVTRLDEKVDGLGREVSEMRGCYLGTDNAKKKNGRLDYTELLISTLKYILILIAGGFLTLGGVSWGQNLIKIVNGGG